MKTPNLVHSTRSEQPADILSLRLTQEDLAALKAKFPTDRLGVKVQSLNKEKTRALLVLYLQHIDVQNRLEEIDPSWSTEVIHEETIQSLCYVRIRMTVKGVARENIGEGADPKSAYSDALKRCAMLFGVGRYLYDSSPVWSDYDEVRDRFKKWNYPDYEKCLQQKRPTPSSSQDRSPLIPGNLKVKAPTTPSGLKAS